MELAPSLTLLALGAVAAAAVPVARWRGRAALKQWQATFEEVREVRAASAESSPSVERTPNPETMERFQSATGHHRTMCDILEMWASRFENAAGAAGVPTPLSHHHRFRKDRVEFHLGQISLLEYDDVGFGVPAFVVVPPGGNDGAFRYYLGLASETGCLVLVRMKSESVYDDGNSYDRHTTIWQRVIGYEEFERMLCSVEVTRAHDERRWAALAAARKKAR
jgi:hypothetical protein